jgi:23S rRNA (uridine2552-2'-O)-methyltransferase
LSNRDFTNEKAKKGMLKAIGKCKTFDIVLSDMAPNASGIKNLDQDRIINLAMKVRDFTLNHGRFGSCLVIKVWQTGSLLTRFTDLLKEDFKDVQHLKTRCQSKRQC